MMFFISSLQHVTVVCFITSMAVLYCLFTLQFNAGPQDLPVPLSCDPQHQQSAHPATNNSDRDRQKCFPKKDIMFMKTHKTASSTFLNILFRFGEKHNLKFFDLGQDHTLDPDDPRVDESIRLIADRFNLVMLVEHFEESLILLKETLCWEIADILFFKLNARQESTVSRLSPELREKALQWNAIDWKLYKYFNRTFWEKVEEYGPERMTKDVIELKRRNAELVKICIEGGHPVAVESIHEEDMKPWQPIGEKSIMGYNLNRNIEKDYQVLCQKMLTPEIQYLTDLGVNLWLTKLWGHVRNIINW